MAIKSEAENTKNVIRRVVRFELAPSTIITFVAVLAGLWVIFKLLPVLLVLVASFFMVGTLNPAVHWLEKRGMGRGTAIGITFGALVVGILGVAVLAIPALLTQGTLIMDQEPALRDQLADRLADFPISQTLSKWLRQFKYGGSVSTAGSTAFTYSMEILGFIAYMLSAIFLALYIMIDRDRLRGGFFAIVPRSHHIRLSRVMMKLETIVGAYIRGQLITSASIGIFILVLLSVCRAPNALALAFLGSIADTLPYIGVFVPIVTAVMAVFDRGPVITLVVLTLMLVYMEFESRVLIPKVYGHALRLPSTVILFSLLAGGTLMGVVGLLLALPFAAAAMMLIEELRVQLPGEQEQAADGVQREKDDQGEKEYERRTEGVSTEQSAAIAVEMSGDRAREEQQVLENEKS